MSADNQEDDDTTNCTVCTEYYEDTGDLLPRILPCTHTLCHSCAVKLVKKGKLQCPQDRVVHQAKNGAETFPQNRYIIKILEKTQKTEDHAEFDICAKHHREMNLYCKYEKCEREICAVCMSEDHSQHETVDSLTLKTEMARALGSEVRSLSEEIQNAKEKLTSTRNNLYGKLAEYKGRIVQQMEVLNSLTHARVEELVQLNESLEVLKPEEENQKVKDITRARTSLNATKIKLEQKLNESLKLKFCELKETEVTLHHYTNVGRAQRNIRSTLGRAICGKLKKKNFDDGFKNMPKGLTPNPHPLPIFIYLITTLVRKHRGGMGHVTCSVPAFICMTTTWVAYDRGS